MMSDDTFGNRKVEDNSSANEKRIIILEFHPTILTFLQITFVTLTHRVMNSRWDTVNNSDKVAKLLKSLTGSGLAGKCQVSSSLR